MKDANVPRKMTLNEKAGAYFLSGRKSDRDFIYYLACVLVGPCPTNLETEGFSLFVAFE